MTRAVFMGTPEFAVPSLRALVEAGYDIVGVVTQPDRPAGRGRRLLAPAVKEAALTLGLPVLQPQTLRRPEIIQELRELSPDVMIVAAYGEILRPEVLSIPPHGCLNLHASLLPRHRGAAPVVATILAGDEVTGITVMLMDEGLDTGPVLAQSSLPVSPDDTTGSLMGKLAYLAADLLIDTLPAWLAAEIVPQPQDHEQATYHKLVHKEDGLVDWSLPAVEIWRRVRAYHPWPGAYTYWQDRQLKILRAQPLEGWAGPGSPGEVIRTTQGIAVVTGQGALLLKEMQMAGKRPLGAEDFVRGRRDFVGASLGSR